VVDLMNRKALPPVELGALRGPHGLVARGGKIWFTAEGAKVIGSYDPASQTIDWVLGTGQDRTHMLTVASDLTHFATSNVSSGTVSLIEKTVVKPGGPPPGPPGAPHDGPPGGGPPPGPKLDWQQTVITVGGGPEGFDVSPDGKELWVANARDGTVSIIDVAKKAVTQTLNADVPGANRLKFTPDGKRVLIATLRGGILAVIDAASRQTVKRLTLGRGASGILIPPDGARAFVACSPDDTIAVIDLKTLTVTGHLEVGHEPDGMAWAIRP
jgi:YVTN family beta-propeller protein